MAAACQPPRFLAIPQFLDKSLKKQGPGHFLRQEFDLEASGKGEE